jgi:hypothetical protein
MMTMTKTARRATFTPLAMGTTFQPARHTKTPKWAKRRPASQVVSVVPVLGPSSQQVR